ncbi:MAG: PD-(D/E)XK nuclease family protein, partial [Polymorphobacter sp.]
PRLAIWGLIEARLQSADLVIMAGLNDGVWPALPAPDPWLAPAIRQQLGMPGLETAIGTAAHDFVAGLGAPRVLLSRARRDDGGPAVPSRFWLRLQALAGETLQPDNALLALARAIDAAGPPVPALRPAPVPPASQRPRRLSITAAEKLRADPFSFYAQAMLKLSVLEPLDADPTGADRGIAVHQILQHWVDSGDSDPAQLRALTEAALLRWSNHPMMRALWAPRVRRAMDWVIDTMRDWEAAGWVPLQAEARGERDFAFGARDAQTVTLVGVADRIDRRPDGSLAIIDYKTGTVPSPAQVATGFALQMGLLGALAQQGVLEGVAAAPVAAFGYWKIGGGTEAGKVSDPLLYNRKPVMSAAAHVTQTLAVFDQLCRDMLLGNAPFTAKLHPDHAEKYRDFDHLARVAEWLGKPGALQ